MLTKWIKIIEPGWNCTVRGGCNKPATWEEDRTTAQILARELPALRCDEHLPSDAIKLDEDEAQPMEGAQ